MPTTMANSVNEANAAASRRLCSSQQPVAQASPTGCSEKAAVATAGSLAALNGPEIDEATPSKPLASDHAATMQKMPIVPIRTSELEIGRYFRNIHKTNAPTTARFESTGSNIHPTSTK